MNDIIIIETNFLNLLVSPAAPSLVHNIIILGSRQRAMMIMFVLSLVSFEVVAHRGILRVLSSRTRIEAE